MTSGGNIEKCVILARGLGKRMRQEDSFSQLDAAQSAAADAGIKAMVPIGRPFLDYVLSLLADAGFRQVCLVIGPEHDAVREYYRKLQPVRIAVSFATQEQPIGTADAVLAAEKFADGNEFLVINSDNYYPLVVLQNIQKLGQPGTVLFEAASLLTYSNIPPERIRDFATCLVDESGFLSDILEKPAVVEPDPRKLVSMNCWRFGPEIFSVCRDVALSPRGELELPLAVKLAIQRGTKLKTAISHTGVLDLSRRSDISAVADRLRNVRVEL